MKSSGKCMSALVALLAIIIPSALTATVTYQSFQNNSQLFMSSGSYFYGNDIILRYSVITDQALMSWVDQATVLPPGWLTRFFLHTFIAVGLPATTPPVPVRLQIWRSVGLQQFRLVWEYRLLMANNINSPEGVFVQVVLNETEQFIVKAGDKLGWTCEGNVCPLCFSELDGTIIAQNTALPNISTSPIVTFQVDPDGVYGLFSVAVEVTPELVQIGSQGPPGLPGSPGLTGPVGSTGATGAEGLLGESVPGADGEAGRPGVAGGTGPAGPQGLPGPQGQPGIELVGPAGPQGPTGLKGSSAGNSKTQVKSDPRLTAAIIGIVVPLSVLTVLILVLIVYLACRMRSKGQLKRKNNMLYNQQRDSSYSYDQEDNSACDQLDTDYKYGTNRRPAHYDGDI